MSTTSSDAAFEAEWVRTSFQRFVVESKSSRTTALLDLNRLASEDAGLEDR